MSPAGQALKCEVRIVHLVEKRQTGATSVLLLETRPDDGGPYRHGTLRVSNFFADALDLDCPLYVFCHFNTEDALFVRMELPH